AGFKVKNFDIDGGPGNDTIAIDDTAGSAVVYSFDTRARASNPAQPYFGYEVSNEPAGIWEYTTTEQITLEQGSGAALTTLVKKAAQTRLTVNTREGDDKVRAGHSQFIPAPALFPANGWTLGT